MSLELHSYVIPVYCLQRIGSKFSVALKKYLKFYLVFSHSYFVMIEEIHLYHRIFYWKCADRITPMTRFSHDVSQIVR